MTKTWIPPIGRVLVLLFLLLGLAIPQVAIAARGLLLSLPAYALVGMAAITAFLTLRPNSQPDRTCLWATGIFGGYVVLRALTSPEPYAARADLYAILGVLTLYCLSVGVLTSARRRMVLICLLLVFALCHVLVSLLQFGLGENFILFPSLQQVEILKRGNGLYINPDHLAGLLEVLGILGLSITCWSRWPRVARVIIGYLTAVCYFGLALTGSRGGYLSVAASLIVFALLSGIALRAGGSSLLQKYGRTGALLAAAAVLLLGTLLMYQSGSLGERLNNIATRDDARLDLWSASVKQWQLKPLIGTGSGTYRFYGREFRTEAVQGDPENVHNDYLHLLCEYGLIGLAAFAVFFYAHLRRGWTIFQRLGPGRIATGSSLLSDRLALNIGALSAIGAYIVHSAVDFNLHIAANALLMAFVFGIVANPGTKASAEEPLPTGNFGLGLATATLGAILLIQSVRVIPGEYYAAEARVALADEHPATAFLLAKQALAHEENNPNIYFCLGRSQLALESEARRSGKSPVIVQRYYDAALTAFERARQLAPLDEAYPLDIAFVYDRMGRFSEAEWMFSIARSRDPNSYSVNQMYKAHLEAWENSGRENALVGTNLTPSE